MFEQAFKNIDDVLWKDAGCTSELDYTEQSSWLLFLKYLDSLEHVIKNTFLSNTDNASVSLRKLLLESCNLHTVLDCPGGHHEGNRRAGRRERGGAGKYQKVAMKKE